ncbi:hypothetical protein LUZ60_000948 [Juncus effusus]|nr:hypothetical protein LUZ60_000948 [Juncus effusus]
MLSSSKSGPTTPLSNFVHFSEIHLHPFHLQFSEIHLSLEVSGAESCRVLERVVVHLRATGDAPILKQAKFKIAGSEKFLKVIEFLRRQLHRDTLFVYVNSAFSPNPDELVIDLFNNFGIDGKLVVNYASSMAWG